MSFKIQRIKIPLTGENFAFSKWKNHQNADWSRCWCKYGDATRRIGTSFGSVALYVDVINIFQFKYLQRSTSKQESTIINWSYQNLGRKNIVKILIENGADVNLKDKRGSTPLYWAAFRNNFEIAKMLLEKGADVNIKNNDGATPRDFAKKSISMTELMDSFESS